MDKVLIVSGSKSSAQSLSEMIGSDSRPQVTFSTNSGEARRIISTQSFDMIIVNSPLADDLGADFSIHAATQTLSSVMFLVKSDLYGMLCARLETYGVLVLEKPINRAFFGKALSLAKATQVRLKGFRQENLKLKNQINEMRLCDRAKAALMKYLNLTEPQAHRFIVKQAMDMRITKTEVAQNILKTYDV